MFSGLYGVSVARAMVYGYGNVVTAMGRIR